MISGLATAYATARLLRLADGPDEVHRDQLARLEFRKQAATNQRGGVAWLTPQWPQKAMPPQG